MDAIPRRDGSAYAHQTGRKPVEWAARLDELLGTQVWRNRLYSREPQQSLFEVQEKRFVRANAEAISEFFIERLRGCFAGVASNPKVLRNSRNFPLYLLCFAAGNPKGATIALKIAGHLLKMGS